MVLLPNMFEICIKVDGHSYLKDLKNRNLKIKKNSYITCCNYRAIFSKPFQMDTRGPKLMLLSSDNHTLVSTNETKAESFNSWKSNLRQRNFKKMKKGTDRPAHMLPKPLALIDP